MRLSQFIVALGFSSGVLAAPCRTGAAWYLEPNDCICMNSTDGAILEKQTATICAAMKYRTADNVCMVDKDMRQTFKDRCKALNQESVIGHCR